jgi:preprotein translocase subunit SecB
MGDDAVNMNRIQEQHLTKKICCFVLCPFFRSVISDLASSGPGDMGSDVLCSD